MGWRLASAALGPACLLALTGCEFEIPDQTLTLPSPPPAVVHDDWPGCLSVGAFRTVDGAEQPDFGRGSIPTGFLPVAAVRCTVGKTEATSGQGLERRATDAAELELLSTYLGKRSQTVRSPETLACPAMAWWPPWLFLFDAEDRWIRPQIPVDACGFPLDLWATDSGVPYDRLTFSDTTVCRSTGEEWNCEKV
jgi:hypothetical protein